MDLRPLFDRRYGVFFRAVMIVGYCVPIHSFGHLTKGPSGNIPSEYAFSVFVPDSLSLVNNQNEAP